MNPDPAQTMQALSLPAVCERNTREYDPVVVSVNLGEMVKKGDKIEQSVVDLWRKFSSAPLAVVPNELKVGIQTRGGRTDPTNIVLELLQI